jgi:hypothetical protein
MRFSVRTEKRAVGDWSTDFQGSAQETADYLRITFTPRAEDHFRRGSFRVYGGEGSTRSKMGIRELRRWGVL